MCAAMSLPKVSAIARGDADSAVAHAQDCRVSLVLELDGERVTPARTSGLLAGLFDRASVLLDDNALVVSAQNRTVITALGMHQARENVFTNIDSVVFAP